jgi:hypothetical protein
LKPFNTKISSKVISNFRNSYNELGYVVWKNFFDVVTAKYWENYYRSKQERKVYVDKETNCLWIEQGFENPQIAFNGLFFEESFHKIIAQIVDLPNLNATKMHIWINRYLPNNIVPAHKDTEGNTQLLICLQETKDKNGGEFFIEKTNFQLNTGDAILFSASKLNHGMREIKGVNVEKSGFSRVICVVRMFEEDNT